MKTYVFCALEPPSPWSRTRFKSLLEFVEFCCFQVIEVESVARRLLNAVEFCGTHVLLQLQNRLQSNERTKDEAEIVL
jgi:hypothetical protein